MTLTKDFNKFEMKGIDQREVVQRYREGKKKSTAEISFNKILKSN